MVKSDVKLSPGCNERTYRNANRIRTREMKERFINLFSNYIKNILSLPHDKKNGWLNENEVIQQSKSILKDFCCEFSINLNNDAMIDEILTEKLNMVEEKYSKNAENMTEILNEFGLNDKNLKGIARKLNDNFYEYLLDQGRNVKHRRRNFYEDSFVFFQDNNFKILNEEIFNKKNLTIKFENLARESKSPKKLPELCDKNLFNESIPNFIPKAVEIENLQVPERLTSGAMRPHSYSAMGSVSIVLFIVVLLCFIFKRNK